MPRLTKFAFSGRLTRSCSARHCVLLFAAVSLAQASPLFRSPIVPPSDSQNATQDGSPPMVVAETDEFYKPALLKDGRLIAVALPKVNGVQEGEAIYSSDNGRTWSSPKKLFTLPREAGTFGYFDFLVDREGELHFFFLLDPSTATTNLAHPTQKEEELDIWHLKSTAGMTNWVGPKQIWHGRGGDLLSVIQLRSGRLLLPISYRMHRNWANRGSGFDAFTYSGEFDSSALYSDDDGDTWHQSPSVLKTPTPDITTIEGAVEPVAIQLKDGRVWMLIRSQMGRFYESYSNDDGKTFSHPQPTSLISSDSPAGLVRLPDGRMLMILNRNLRFPYAYGGRHVLQAAISNDEGRTWHGYREIVRDPLRQDPPPPGSDFGPAYSYPAVTRDGKVVFSLACETGTRNADPNTEPGFVAKQKRHLFLLDPAWLEQTSQRTDFSAGVDDWSIFGVKGVELVPDPTKPGARVLSVRKTQPDWPAAAVWNFPMGTSGHVRLKLMVKPGLAEAQIGLTDHYSVPYDPEDTFYNRYNFVIGPNGRLKNGDTLESNRWYVVDLSWDTVAREGRVSVDGRQVEILPLLHQSDGICYLRLKSTSPTTDMAGFLVASVDAEVVPVHSTNEERAVGTVPRPKSLDEAQAWIDHLWYLQSDWPQLGRYGQANLEVPPPTATEQRVVFLGDSITDSWNLARWFPGKPYINRGIDGQTTPQMLLRFRTDVIKLRPKVVVILAGTNDLAGNTGPTTLDAIEQNYAAMVDLATRNGVVPVLSSVLPIHDRGPVKMTERRSPEQIEALNRWLQQYCIDHRLIYLDYFNHMVAGDGMLRSDLSDDGLHPNAAGYALMSPLAERAIEAAVSAHPGLSSASEIRNIPRAKL